MQEISATLSSPSSSCSCVWRHWCPPSALWSCPPSPPLAWMWRWVRAPADPRLRAAAPLGLPGGSSHLSPFVRSHPHRSLVSCPLHPLCSELPLLEHLPELFLSQLLQFVSSQPPPPPACGGSSGLTPPSTLADPQNNLQTVQHRRVNLCFWKLLLLCSGVCVPSQLFFSGTGSSSTRWRSCITRVISVSCCSKLASWSAVTPFTLKRRRNRETETVHLTAAPCQRREESGDITVYIYPPVRTVVCVGNNVLHHQLRFSQFLLQLS